VTRHAIGHAIGIDIGGTKIAAGLVELSTARIIAREMLPTRPERGGAAVLRDTLEVAKRLHAHGAGIGVQVCGLGLAGGLYWDSFVASTRKRIWAEASRALPIRTAQLGLDAGVVGAALCAPGATAPAVGYS
jgi:predicted NBD/HSP70 family sugar kinase